MRRLVRLSLGFALVASIGLGIVATLSAPARAVDNPCDPTFQMLQRCKQLHGRWDSSCCCCVYH